MEPGHAYPVPEGAGAVAALPPDEGGDALVEEPLSPWVVEYAYVAVVVDVDEPRGNDVPRAVEDLGGVAFNILL